METSHIVIIFLIVLCIAGIITYFILNKKKTVQKDDLFEQAVKEKEKKSIQTSILRASDGENAAQYHELITPFTKRPKDYQETVDALFELCGCPKQKIDINQLISMTVPYNKDPGFFPLYFLILHQAKRNPNKLPHADEKIQLFKLLVLLEEASTKLNYTYDLKKKEVTFIGERTNEFFEYAPDRATITIDEFRKSLLKLSVQFDKITLVIQSDDYLNNYPLCNLKL